MSTKERWFLETGVQSPLLRARLHQTGLTEMLIIWEIRESLIIRNQILCVPEGITSGIWSKSGGELQGVVGN